MATKQKSTSERLQAAAKRRAKQSTEPTGDQLADPKAEGDEAVLELSLGPGKRPFIVINDERYHYRRMIEFGGLEHEEFSRYTAEYDKLHNRSNERRLSKQDSNRKEWLLDWLFDHVLVRDDAVRLRADAGDALTSVAKREIVLAFTTASSLPSDTAAAARQAAGWRALLQAAAEEELEPEDSSPDES